MNTRSELPRPIGKFSVALSVSIALSDSFIQDVSFSTIKFHDKDITCFRSSSCYLERL